MNNQELTNSEYSGADPLMGFQLEQLSIDQKSSKEWGLKISQKISSYSSSGVAGYYFNRNLRFQRNADFAYGRINVQAMFQDRFQYNGKENYIRLAWNTLQIVNRIISGLVGRWMQRNEKVVVQATDSLSMKDKQEEYENIQFILENRAKLEELEKASGVGLIPKNIEIPADKEELNLWKQEFQRLPEEIETEMVCNNVLAANGWFTALKQLMLRDSAVKGLVGTYTTMDDEGVIRVEWLKPDNIIYSATDFDDFRDTTWRGQIPSLKVSELRRWYGKEFNPNNPNALDEEQIWKIAQTSKEYKSVTNINWIQDWAVPFNLRPYDEWNVRCMMFELKTVDTDKWTVTKTKNNTTYTQKGEPVNVNGNKKKPSDNQKIIEDTYWNIYEGIYLPDNDILLKWQLKKNMIRPQDPKEVGNAEFSYSFYMYQNYNQRNMAIPEKIEAAVDNMMLACLKMQQVISRMRPTGAAINADAVQEIDFGLGENGSNTVDIKKLYDQTGDIYYRGRDAEGNPLPVPITELQNSGFIGQMQGLIQDYQFWYQTLKDELGEDPNLIQAATQPRVTSQNVQAAQVTSEFATDYMYDAYIECMKQTAAKITCLAKDSIHYGAKAYREIVKQPDISNRIYATDIKLMPTQQEIAAFDAMLQNAIASQPELAMFVNQFQAMQMAKENFKLAWVYYNQCLKKMLIWRQQTAEQNQQATFEAQVVSAQKAEEAKQKTEQIKIQGDLEAKKIEGETANKNYIVAMVTSLLSKDTQIPAYLMPIVSATMENIMIPLVVQNDENKKAIIQQYQQAAQQQQQMMATESVEAPQMQPQENMQQQPIQQPPPQVAA